MTVVDITRITQDDLDALEAVRDDIWAEVEKYLPYRCSLSGRCLP